MGRRILEMGLGKAVSTPIDHSERRDLVSGSTAYRVLRISFSPFSLLAYEMDPISLK
jgi:hypothetical protein